MINLLKFRPRTEDGQQTGEDRFGDYMKAVAPFLQSAGGRVLYFGDVRATLIGPNESEWDRVIVVHYPDRSSFLKMAASPDFPSKLREEALQDSRLICCVATQSS